MTKDIIILAAGVGSRLRPLTDDIPKTMVNVNNDTIIGRLLKQIDNVEGLEKRIKIVSGYKSSILKNYINSLGLSVDIEFIENPDYDTTNNMYSLYLAIKELKNDNGMVIINADCCYEQYIVDSILKASSDTIAIDKGFFNEESMKVKTSKDDQILEMSKQLNNIEQVYVSIDIYTFTKQSKEKLYNIAQTYIDGGDLNSWTEVAIDQLAREEDSNINCKDFKGKKWIEIDNHQDLQNANKIFTN